MTFVEDSIALRLLAAILLAQGAAAQSTLTAHDGASQGDRLSVVVGGRDLDGDGVDDYVVAAPDSGSDAGAVYAYAGSTGLLLWSRVGSAGDRLGHALDFVEDLDGDGVPDLVVGSPGALQAPGNAPGAVSVLSGTSGGTILVRWGENDGDGLGYSVAGGFDWDHDGTEDFAGGAPFWNNSGEAGRAYVWSGATGLQLWTAGSLFSAHLGEAMAGVGDLNMDGHGDLAVGAPYAFPNGEVFVYGGNGVMLWSLFGELLSEHFGSALAPAGDVDLDGHPDFLVGAPGWNGARGRVRLHSGSSGLVLSSWDGDVNFDHLGSSLACVGDVDGDGRQDFAAGAPQPAGYGPGFVRVVSLKFGVELYDLVGADLGDEFGSHVAGVGDVNQDGVPDLGVGAPGRDGSSAPVLADAGRVTIYSGGCPGFVNYCTAGTSASGCQARISGSGTPSWFAATGFTLSATEVEGNKRALFYYGWLGRQASPWGKGTSYQCVVPPLKRAGVLSKTGTSGVCDGYYSQDLNAYWKAHPNQNPGPGAVVQAQLWYRDPGSTSNLTTSLSNALEFVVCN